jgi:hypothetical protein
MSGAIAKKKEAIATNGYNGQRNNIPQFLNLKINPRQTGTWNKDEIYAGIVAEQIGVNEYCDCNSSKAKQP